MKIVIENYVPRINPLFEGCEVWGNLRPDWLNLGWNFDSAKYGPPIPMGRGECNTYVTRDYKSIFNTVARMVGYEEVLQYFATGDIYWKSKDVLDLVADIYVRLNKSIIGLYGPRLKYAFMGDDVAYNTGLMMSPKAYEKWIMPHHARMIELYHESDIEVVFHSDGDIHELIPCLKEIGVDYLHPIETVGAMDLGAALEVMDGRVIYRLDEKKLLWIATAGASNLVELSHQWPNFRVSVWPQLMDSDEGRETFKRAREKLEDSD